MRVRDDVETEARRLKRIHAALIAFPGRDRFAFRLELPDGRGWWVEFPRATTHWCPDLETRLRPFLRDDETWHLADAAAS